VFQFQPRCSKVQRDALREVLTIEEELRVALEAAREREARAIEQFHSATVGVSSISPTDMLGLKHAAEEATGAYLVALERFSNFVIHETVPDDLECSARVNLNRAKTPVTLVSHKSSTGIVDKLGSLLNSVSFLIQFGLDPPLEQRSGFRHSLRFSVVPFWLLT